MTLEQINALTLDNCFREILYRLVDFSSVPRSENGFSFSEGEGTLYERLELYSSLTKPTLQAFNDEFATYKAELDAAECARLAELERIAVINSRWDAFVDISGVIKKAGYSIHNPAFELNRIIKDNDTVRLTEYEQANTLHIQDCSKQKSNADARKYLADTDWMIIRQLEGGVACPQAIKDARASARLAVK